MTIEQIYREESGRALATPIRLLGDFNLARGDRLRRLERGADAATAYRRALLLAQQVSEQKFLARRLADVEKRREQVS
jgi:predicted RNA polymerase sigma factor